MDPIGRELAPAAQAVADDLLDVNCSRCGRPLLVRIDDLRDKPAVECPECERMPKATDGTEIDVPASAEEGPRESVLPLERPPGHRTEPR